MQLCRKPHLSIAVVVIMLIGAHAGAQPEFDAKKAALDERLEDLLHAVVIEGELGANSLEFVPALVRMIERNQSAEPDLLILALQRLKSKSDAVIRVLCKKLDDPSHAVRRAAVQALVAIGNDSVPALQETLKLQSGRARVGAAEALARLKAALASSDLERLVADPDARVRDAAARLLGHRDKPAVVLLTKLLQDPEVAVAIDAARALATNQHDPALSIASLIEALKRRHLGWAAAEALAAYGTDARRAIPGIIKAYPLGKLDRFDWGDAAEETLKHLGPADPDDIPALCELLSDQDPEIQILSANSLSAMGVDGRRWAIRRNRATGCRRSECTADCRDPGKSTAGR